MLTRGRIRLCGGRRRSLCKLVIDLYYLWARTKVPRTKAIRSHGKSAMLHGPRFWNTKFGGPSGQHLFARMFVIFTLTGLIQLQINQNGGGEVSQGGEYRTEWKEIKRPRQ